jgi:hypothetical protein
MTILYIAEHSLDSGKEKIYKEAVIKTFLPGHVVEAITEDGNTIFLYKSEYIEKK